jgi:hypothetical protein
MARSGRRTPRSRRCVTTSGRRTPTFAQRLKGFDERVAAHALENGALYGTRVSLRVGHRSERVAHRYPFVGMQSESLEHPNTDADLRPEPRVRRSLSRELVGHRSADRARRRACRAMRSPVLTTPRPSRGRAVAFFAMSRPRLATHRLFLAMPRLRLAMHRLFLALRHPLVALLCRLVAMQPAFRSVLEIVVAVSGSRLGVGVAFDAMSWSRSWSGSISMVEVADRAGRVSRAGVGA